MKYLCLFAVAAQAIAGEAPAALTVEQIQGAITHGAKFKTQEKYYQKGMLVKKELDLVTVGMSSRIIMAFGDWDYIAAQSALAHQLMKPFTAADVKRTGNLHALMKIIAPERFAKMNARYGNPETTNLVLQIGETLLQPIQQSLVSQTDIMAIGQGMPGTSWLLYHFQIDDADMLRLPTVATFINAKGQRSSRKIALAGLLDPPDRSLKRR